MEGKCIEGIVKDFNLLGSQAFALVQRIACSGEGCGLLAVGQTALQLHKLEIRRDCAHLFRCCRLLVVFTEGGDLCSLNKESLPETCEIGVQGVSSTGYSCA